MQTDCDTSIMKLGELGRKKGQKQHPVVSEIRQVKKQFAEVRAKKGSG
jgi:hypothetical protein